MDSKLLLKPVELIDIGIDKLTKIPIPILNENIITTYDIDMGVPSDTFIFSFNANYSNSILSMTIVSDSNVTLTFNYGDGFVENRTLTTGYTYIEYTYPSAITYNIIISGWLDKIYSLSILPYGSYTGGITTASLNKLRNLEELILSNNRLTSLNLEGMIYLKYIYLDDNYLSNDAIDDSYIDVDTFLTFKGFMSTTGINNGKPSIYSEYAISSLIDYKGWNLSYNI